MIIFQDPTGAWRLKAVALNEYLEERTGDVPDGKGGWIKSPRNATAADLAAAGFVTTVGDVGHVVGGRVNDDGLIHLTIAFHETSSLPGVGATVRIARELKR